MKSLTKKVMTLTLLSLLSMGAFGLSSTVTVISSSTKTPQNAHIVLKLVNPTTKPSFCVFKQLGVLQQGIGSSMDFSAISSQGYHQGTKCTQSQVSKMLNGAIIRVVVVSSGSSWICTNQDIQSPNVTITEYGIGSMECSAT